MILLKVNLGRTLTASSSNCSRVKGYTAPDLEMQTQGNSDIPVVDLSSPTAPQELLQAASSNGFIFVEHSDGIDLTPQQVEDMFENVRVCCFDKMQVKQE